MRFPFISRSTHEAILQAEERARTVMAEAHGREIQQMREALALVTETLHEQIDGLSEEKKLAIDRLMWLGIGVPLYKQVVETAAPEPQGGQSDEMDSRHGQVPRGAILHNPRRFARATTLSKIVEANKNRRSESLDAVAKALADEADKRARTIPEPKDIPEAG